MSLTNEERRALERIERELRRADPLLASRMETAPTLQQRRRRVLLARRGAWLGAAVLLIGLVTAQGVLSLGAVIAGYGLVILLVSLGVAAYNRSPIGPNPEGARPPDEV